MAEEAKPTDPAVSLRFTVTIDGKSIGNFTTCSGLKVEVVMEQREEGGTNGFVWQLPSRVKYSNITLKRAVCADSQELTDWLIGFANEVSYKTACITAMTGDGKKVTSWNLDGVVPVSWSGPDFDVGANNVAMETLVLAHHGFLPSGGGAK
ncbi:MAG: phage tail protein [Microlunatus sp.]